MKQGKIVRLETNPEQGTFGTMLISGDVFCVTLEPYSRDNARNVSCIPTGQYLCKRIDSPTYGITFEVTNIQDRNYVLFHPGNIAGNTEGCILLGQYYGKLGKDRAVLNSGATFIKFLRIMAGVDIFKLTITEAF